MRCKRLAWVLILLIAILSSVVLAAPNQEEGWSAYREGRNDEAYEIFSELFKQDPADEQINYGLGMSALEKGKLSHALFAFERVLMLNPENQRARLELARTYYLMGQSELARENFEVVMASDPPEKVRESIQIFLDRIEQQSEKIRYSGYLELSGFYDDNVNYGPASRNIDTLLGDLRVSDESTPKEAWGAALSLAGSFARELDGGLDWMAIGGISGYQSWMDDAYRQEMRLGQAYAGLRRMARTWLWDITANVADMRYGHEHLLKICGLGTVWLYSPDPRSQWISRAGVDYRDFGESERDAWYYSFEETFRRFLGRRRHSVALTAGGIYDDTASDGYRNYGAKLRLSGEVNLPWHSEAYAYIQCRRLEYAHITYTSLQKEDRRDTQWRGRVGLNKQLSPHWSIDAYYQATDNESNFDLYDYDRNLLTVSSRYSF